MTVLLLVVFGETFIHYGSVPLVEKKTTLFDQIIAIIENSSEKLLSLPFHVKAEVFNHVPFSAVLLPLPSKSNNLHRSLKNIFTSTTMSIYHKNIFTSTTKDRLIFHHCSFIH